jgi:hypothetical protein
MSGGPVCECIELIGRQAASSEWVVTQRRSSQSAFNGYRKTPSVYSEVACRSCLRRWRTKARYVDDLPDGGAVS